MPPTRWQIMYYENMSILDSWLQRRSTSRFTSNIRLHGMETFFIATLSAIEDRLTSISPIVMTSFYQQNLLCKHLFHTSTPIITRWYFIFFFKYSVKCSLTFKSTIQTDICNRITCITISNTFFFHRISLLLIFIVLRILSPYIRYHCKPEPE